MTSNEEWWKYGFGSYGSPRGSRGDGSVVAEYLLREGFRCSSALARGEITAAQADEWRAETLAEVEAITALPLIDGEVVASADQFARRAARKWLGSRKRADIWSDADNMRDQYEKCREVGAQALSDLRIDVHGSLRDEILIRIGSAVNCSR